MRIDQLVGRTSGLWTSGIVLALLGGMALPLASYCPDQLLFTYGGYYYYSSKDCDTGAAGNVLVYSQLVTTGCSGSGCNAEVLPHAELKPKGVVGDPPGDDAEVPESEAYALVPPTTELMTSFGKSPVSLAGGAGDYPRIVSADVEGTTRYFKLYRLYLKSGGDSFGVGTEVSAPPAGSTPAPGTATFDSYGKGVMWLNYNDPYVGSFGFQCLYVAAETPTPVPAPVDGSGG